MVRPLALSSLWSLLALACLPLTESDDSELAAPDEAAEPTDEVIHTGPESSTCSGPRPTELVAIDLAAEPDQAQLKIAGPGGTWLGLPLQAIRYDTVVVGTLAETTVTQTFVNPGSDRLEALYTFPLPDDAAVDDYWIRVGSHAIHGLLKRREDAQRSYDEAREAGRTAALLTQERPNVFTQAVTNIGPGQTVEVEIHLVQPLRQRAGRYTLALPTVVGPRYVPPGSIADASRIRPPVLAPGVDSCVPVEIDVAIDTTLPVADVASKMHAVSVTPHAQGVAVALARGPVRADRDFELSWRLAGAQPRAELMAQKQGDGGYFALTIQPPQGFDAGKSRPRELVFVVDVSGSMAGIPLDTAKAAIERALDGMRPDDTFNVITFAGSALTFETASVANTPDNRRRALDFLVNTHILGGGTQMLTGISAALDVPKDPERLRMVLFMTDGYIGNESQIFAALDARRGDARLFALGVGSSVNRFLVDGLAHVGHGTSIVVGPGESPKAVVDEFYESIDRPVLTDISIDWGGLAVDDVAPAHLPDLFAGQPVVVHGRYTGELAGALKLRGKLGGADVELPIRLASARVAEHDGLASMWARRRIDELSSYPLNQSPGELAGPQRDAVVALALRHRILTAYTAFVAVDERRERRPDGSLHTVQIPVETPFGVDMNASEGAAGLGSLGLIGNGGGGGTGSGYGRGAGAGFGGRGTRVPTVRQAKAEVMGSLDRDLIRRVVRAHVAEVRACYDRGLQRDPNLRGRVTIEFAINGKGGMDSTRVAEDTLADNSVASCIAAAAMRWTFPANPDGAVTVRYPFVLEPG